MLHAPSYEGEGDQPSPIRLRALSLGAGVQFTTMALLAAHGEIGPMPHCAIFADTGWEPLAVYTHLEWLMSGNVLPFPMHVVSSGNIRAQLLEAGEGRRWASIPAFARTVTPSGAELPVFGEDEDGELIEIGSRGSATETVSIGMIPQAMHHRLQDRGDPKEGARTGPPDTQALAAPSGRRAVDRHLDRRGRPRQAELRSVADQALSVDRDTDEPSGLPRLVAPARLSRAPEIGLHRLPVPRQPPLAPHARP